MIIGGIVMNKVLNNKKGFTLIELLAVIVILAILVMVAIPAVTRYLTDARKGTFADNAQAAISAVRNDVIMKGGTVDNYDLDAVNELLEKKLTSSPWGKAYDGASTVYVSQSEDGSYTYSMCLFDSDGHGFKSTAEKEITKDKVS